MKRQSSTIVLIALLMAACAKIQNGPSYKEGLVLGIDLNEWEFVHVESDQNQRIVKYVRPGEKIDNWTELFTSQTIRKPANPEPISAMVARIHESDEKLCPNGFTIKFIRDDLLEVRDKSVEESIVYELKFKNCHNHADSHEVYRIIYGKFNIFRISYISNGQTLSDSKQYDVVRQLYRTTIMVMKY